MVTANTQHAGLLTLGGDGLPPKRAAAKGRRPRKHADNGSEGDKTYAARPKARAPKAKRKALGPLKGQPTLSGFLS